MPFVNCIRVLNTTTRTGRLGLTTLGWGLALALSACGGGGSEGSESPPGLIAPAASSSTSPALQGHFERLNEVRRAMALPVVLWNDSLASAAQKHASYQSINKVHGHEEVPGLPGFVGAGFGDRAAAAGYPGALVGEVIIGGDPQTQRDGSALMDILLAAPGHRTVLLAPEFTDAGMGTAPLTTKLGASGKGYVAADKVVVYPYDGQTSVLTSFSPASESPNPLPGVQVTGMPLSVQAGRLFASFVVTRASLTETSAGLDVELLANDAFGQTRSAFTFFPKDRLRPDTSYRFSAELDIAGRSRTVGATFVTGKF